MILLSLVIQTLYKCIISIIFYTNQVIAQHNHFLFRHLVPQIGVYGMQAVVSLWTSETTACINFMNGRWTLSIN